MLPDKLDRTNFPETYITSSHVATCMGMHAATGRLSQTSDQFPNHHIGTLCCELCKDHACHYGMAVYVLEGHFNPVQDRFHNC